MQITEITGRRDKRRFIQFPHDLYRDHPLWVPPMRRDVAYTLNRRHPLFDHSDAAFFLAEGSEGIVGRIAVIENRRWNDYQGRRDAHFYWFDVADDPAITAALMDRAAAWAAARSLNRLLGPKGFLPTDGMGVLVDGFEHPPAMGSPYNYGYYGGHLDRAGFEKVTDYLTGPFDDTAVFPPGFLDAANAAAEDAGYRSHMFRTRFGVWRWTARIGETYNEIFTGNWEYTPLTEQEMRAVGRQFVPIADPRLIMMLMLGDRIVGHIFILPDVTAAIRRVDGRLLPTGWWRILRERRKTRSAHLSGMGVVAEHRGTAANMVLYSVIARLAPDVDYDQATLGQVDEGNTRIMRNLSAMQLQFDRRYRIYQRPI